MYQTNKPSTLVLKTKPIFNPLIVIFRFLPFQIFATLWISIASRILADFIIGNFNLVINPLNFVISTGTLTFFLFPLIIIFRSKNMYKKMEYRIYSDRIEYTEGFWIIEEKTLLFKNITETNLKIGIFQNKIDLGTVFLATPGIVRNNKYGTQGGLHIRDIENPKAVYKKLSELMA